MGNFATTDSLQASVNTGLPSVASLQLNAVFKRGDYEGWTWLSPPVAYPSTVGYEANEGNV